MQWPYKDPTATQLLCSCDPGETELDDDDESGLVDTEERVRLSETCTRLPMRSLSLVSLLTGLKRILCPSSCLWDVDV